MAATWCLGIPLLSYSRWKWPWLGAALLLGGPAFGEETFEPCLLDAGRQVPAVKAQCRFMSVPENWANPEGKTIQLRVAKIAARKSSEAVQDPILFLAGGPGQAALEAYPLLAAAFESINETRDVVLIDQRGTGESTPLDCEIDSSWDLLESEADVDWEGYVRGCLEGITADPRHFTTVDAVADFEHVRKALGYEQYNLVGVSYGTRAALTYVSRHPDSIRSVVIDGVVPSQEPLGYAHAINLENALATTFRRCSDNPACNRQFPDLANKLKVLLERLAYSSEVIQLRHPTTGEVMSLEVSDQILGVAIRILSYSPATVALLPLLIHDAAENDNLEPLAAQAIMAVESISDQLSRGMELSVLCSEDEPYFPAGTYSGEDTVLGRSLVDGISAQCEFWPHKPAPANFKTPTQSDIPTLLLSGELDPVTPPRFADMAAQTLSNSLHIVAPGQGHNVIHQGCVPKLVQQFLNEASVSELDSECVNTLGPEPFFTSFSGPEP